MRLKLLLTLAAATLCMSAFADPASHRKTAGAVLDLINGPAALKSGVSTALGTMLDNMRQQGAPEGAIDEFRDAVESWVEKELVWDEIKPRMIEIYVREFSEEELKQLLAFYQTPVGAKALERFPAIFAEGARIGQEYARSKQPSLNERLERIAAKYEAQRKTSPASH